MIFKNYTYEPKPISEFIDITDQIYKFVHNSKVVTGLCLVYSKHTTACIRLIENENLLMFDMHDFFERMAPSTVLYRHDDIEHRTVPPDERKNGFSHLRAMLLNHQENIPIINGQLDLGKWQRIFYMDCDFGHEGRTVNVLIIGNLE